MNTLRADAPALEALTDEALTDEALVARIREGDHLLFELLMRRHNQRLFRIASAVLRDDAAALDALQEAYLKAFQHLSSLREGQRVRAWLNTIARNEALMAKRRQWREVQLDEAAERRRAHTDSPERDVHQHQLQALLEASIDRLDDDLREVFVLRAVEGMSTREVEVLCALPSGTVKTRYSRARHALLADIERQIEAPLDTLFQFDGARCDRVVDAVMHRLGLRP